MKAPAPQFGRPNAGRGARDFFARAATAFVVASGYSMNDAPNTAAGVAAVEEIRERFPALARRHNGAPVAYFDGPGGTQVPREVADAVVDYLLHHNANTHWSYPT